MNLLHNLCNQDFTFVHLAFKEDFCLLIEVSFHCLCHQLVHLIHVLQFTSGHPNLRWVCFGCSAVSQFGILLLPFRLGQSPLKQISGL